MLGEHKEINKELYGNMFDYIESYVSMLELAYDRVHYEIHYNGKHAIHEFTVYMGVPMFLQKKTAGIYVHLAGDFLMKHGVHLKGYVAFTIWRSEDFNARSFAHRLKKYNLKWKKKNEGIYYKYDISLYEDTDVANVIQALAPFIP